MISGSANPLVAPPPSAALAGVFNQVKEVEVLDSSDWAHLNVMGRPDLGVTLTKLHCWALTEYTKCVFLDADMLVSPVSSVYMSLVLGFLDGDSQWGVFKRPSVG